MASCASKFPLRVGLIGHGAIGSEVASALMNSTHGLDNKRIKLVAVLTNTERSEVHTYTHTPYSLALAHTRAHKL